MQHLSISNGLVAILLLFISWPVLGQTDEYTAASDAAWAFYETEDYADCVKAHIRLMDDYPAERGGNAYMVACCAALDGQVDLAFDYLTRSVETDYWKNLELYRDDPDLDTLRTDARWKTLEDRLMAKTRAYQQVLATNAAPFFQADEAALTARWEASLQRWLNLPQAQWRDSVEQGLPLITHQTDTTQYLSLELPYRADLNVPFLVQLPKGYDSRRTYPLLFHLHGAVRHIEAFPPWVDAEMAGGWNQYFSQYADSLGVIMVYPVATQDYNWLTPTDGFDLVPNILRFLKLRLNIDDDKVFVSGHSNGATGAFTLAVLQPSAFAGAFGLNTHPQVYTGATPIQNLQNRPFHAIATDQDYYYPLSGIDSLARLAQTHDIQFTSSRYLGFPHWFPAFPESEVAVAEIFTLIQRQKRKPFNPAIYWACDDVRYGRCDWLSITKLDTLRAPCAWYEEMNFTVPNWVDVDDETKVIPDYSEAAFLFPRKVGAVRARWVKHRLYLETSRVGEVEVRLHPQLLLEKTKRITVFVNGKKIGRYPVASSRAQTYQALVKDRDRTAAWEQILRIVIKNARKCKPAFAVRQARSAQIVHFRATTTGSNVFQDN
ncbi:MAG: hypothetical protein AAGJ82_07935 [Bacteroidota bacterium]